MDYLKINLPASPDIQEILIALLQELPFDTFQEQVNQLEAYVPINDWNELVEKRLAEIIDPLQISYTKEVIHHKNWNANWESSFKPILIPGKCLVRANFHKSLPKVPIEIEIQPKMAFGTGHHATTYLVMEQCFNTPFKGKKVLDYGCGTGILAILASKLGAIVIDAIDNDPLSTENTADNLIINDISNVKTFLGTLDLLAGNIYDVILANINRNVLLDSADTLFQQLSNNGILILSGLLEKDKTVILDTYETLGFQLKQIFQKDGWLCIQFEKA